MTTITHQVALFVEHCCQCGTPFGIDETLHRSHKINGDLFYCPNGHPQHYSHSIEDQLRRAKEDAAWWRENAERTARSLSATRGILTRTKNRIAKGVCPCCHRQFVQLARHIATKHPDYEKE